MTKLEIMHIEYLQEMTKHKNADWALEAYNELKEIKAQLTEKGIFVI